MRNVIGLDINRSADFVKRHKKQLSCFFESYLGTIPKRCSTPILAYQITKDSFDSTGMLWFDIRRLSKRSVSLLQTIEDSFRETSFFVVRKEKIGSRGYVYYCSAKRDKEKMVSVLRFLDFLCLGLDLILQNYEKHTKSWEFGIYALLDMVRYHTIILCEALNWSNQKIIDCLEEIIKIFYGYLEGNIDEAKRINKVLTVLKGEAQTLIGTSLKMDLRNYKEADHPFYNIVFRDTISEMLGERTIDSIIGIRFGGASLPLLLKKHFPYASISFFEVSNYSKKTNPNGVKIPNISPSSSVLVLDDNILTGRTLEKVIRALKNQHVKEIYFGCISCSGMKRYPQMIMRNHGVVNTDVLIASCIITESQYTKIYSSKSYKNRHGVFDINKNIIQKRLRDKIMGYKL